MGLESVISTPVAPPPPKAAAPASPSSSSSTGSSSGASSSQASAGSTSGSSGAANNGSASSANGSAPKTPAKSGNSASNRNATSNTPGKNASASSQTKQNASSTQTQSTQTQSTAAGSASSARNGATQPATPTGPSFIEALAQSQADAADSASAATTITADASPEDVIGGKAKAAKGADADPTAASFGFLSQSLVAAMAGGPQPNAGAQAPATGDSTDGVSLASGSTIQSVVANLTNGTADGLPGATADGADKTAGSARVTGAADGSASGTSTFQAQMGVSSHFQTNSTANTQTTDGKVSSPVGSTAFNEEVGGKVTWMASQKLQSASLQITPEHMGPVEVRISMQNGATSVAFSANHADTRAALEQALPRLREMFATQGLTLSDASVSQQSPRGQSQKQAVAAIGAIGGASSDDEATSSVTAVSSARPGLVDTYA